MKRPIFTAFLMLFAMGFSQAQNHVFLTLEGGGGYGIFRDLGISPITYQGLELAPAFALNFSSPTWQYQVALGAQGGGYGYRPGFASMQHYGGLPYFSVSAMRNVLQKNRLSVWGGLQLSEMMDIRHLPALGNTSTNFSNFINLSILGRAEYEVARFRFHGQLCFAPASVCLRPGFAYLDNFNQDISSPTHNTFDQYAWYVAALTSVYTDLGATLTLNNGNRIGLAYRWHYLTSRAQTASAPFVFEQASHAIVVSLDFILK
ncbi:MAG: hypothetical protein MJZ86_06150 [Bacteroidales bacterium]|nr:hypothetical protein [Bacteroidales bacterium]